MPDLILPRRTLLAGTALLAAPAILSRRSQAAEQCIVGTWGGDYARLLRENIDDPILKPEGVNVIQDIGDENPRVSKLYAQKRLPRGTDDIACVGALNGYRVTGAGLVEDLDEKQVPNLKHVDPNLRMPAFVPQIYSAQVLVYNPDRVKDPPQSLGDLLDSKWHGKIGMVSTVAQWVIMAASLLESGTTTDFDKAKAFMLKLNANGLRLYAETDALAPAFKSGEIDVGVIWLARTFMWQNAGFPVKGAFPKEGAILYVSGMVLPKNAPDKDAAYKYMNALLEPSAQQGFAAHMGYLPTVNNAPLSGKVGQQLAFPRPAPKLVPPDYPVLSKAMPDLNDWWLKNIQHA
ncbi:MAG TPA: extracellular solute-binding protein [Acetobacteraceae bacterium]|nr:extracellular solute-binding protein [Acetobacteraceae bacterium]